MDYLFALQTIREAAPGFINLLFILVSEYLVILSFIAPAVIYWAFDKSAGATILLGYTFSYQMNQTIKNIACVYRPWIKDSRLFVEAHAVKSATGYSFPSGHTTTAASVYGGIGVWQKKRKTVVILMFFMVLLTAFARNWLGAHTLQDVVCAVVFTGIWLCFVTFLKYWIEKNPSKDTIILISGLCLDVLILLFVSLKTYPMDYNADGELIVVPYKMITDCYSAFGCFAGGLLGWWLERHFLNFSTDVSKKAKTIRIAVGIPVTLLMYLVLGKAFSFTGEHVCHLIKYFIIFMYLFYLHPLFITKAFERKGK